MSKFKFLYDILGAVTYPTNKIDPILRGIKLRYQKPLAIEGVDTNEQPEKSVTCCVLSEPKDEAKADIVFVHGLHGSLVSKGSKIWAILDTGIH